MQLHALDSALYAAAVPSLAALERVARRGIRSLVDNRETDAGSISFETIRTEAKRLGLHYARVPLSSGESEGALDKLREVVERLPRPLVMFSDTGVQSASAYIRSQREYA